MVRFVVILGGLTLAFNALFYLWVSEQPFFEAYLNLNARASAAFLNFFGDNVRVTGTSLSSPRYALDIKSGCDGLQSSAFFVLAVLASQVSTPLLRRVPAIVVGTVVMLAVNLARIVSLYYTGIYFPSAFETMHIDVWQAVFIFLPLVLWILWIRRAIQPKVAKSHDAAKHR